MNEIPKAQTDRRNGGKGAGVVMGAGVGMIVGAAFGTAGVGLVFGALAGLLVDTVLAGTVSGRAGKKYD